MDVRTEIIDGQVVQITMLPPGPSPKVYSARCKSTKFAKHKKLKRMSKWQAQVHAKPSELTIQAIALIKKHAE